MGASCSRALERERCVCVLKAHAAVVVYTGNSGSLIFELGLRETWWNKCKLPPLCVYVCYVYASRAKELWARQWAFLCLHAFGFLRVHITHTHCTQTARSLPLVVLVDWLLFSHDSHDDPVELLYKLHTFFPSPASCTPDRDQWRCIRRETRWLSTSRFCCCVLPLRKQVRHTTDKTEGKKVCWTPFSI